MGLSSETRFGSRHTFRLRASLWKAFPAQECSCRTRSRAAVKKAGKVVEGIYTRTEYVWRR